MELGFRLNRRQFLTLAAIGTAGLVFGKVVKDIADENLSLESLPDDRVMNYLFSEFFKGADSIEHTFAFAHELIKRLAQKHVALQSRESHSYSPEVQEAIAKDKERFLGVGDLVLSTHSLDDRVHRVTFWENPNGERFYEHGSSPGYLREESEFDKKWFMNGFSLKKLQNPQGSASLMLSLMNWVGPENDSQGRNDDKDSPISRAVVHMGLNYHPEHQYGGKGPVLLEFYFNWGLVGVDDIFKSMHILRIFSGGSFEWYNGRESGDVIDPSLIERQIPDYFFKDGSASELVLTYLRNKTKFLPKTPFPPNLS